MLYRKETGAPIYFINGKELTWFQKKSRDGARSQNAYEGASKPLTVPVSCTLESVDETASETQPPLGINATRVSWFQKAGTLTSGLTQRLLSESPVVQIALLRHWAA